MLGKIKLQPGINRDTTAYTNSGGWFDSDFIRFRNGLPEKIGGWTRIYANQTALIGKCRKLYDWSDLVGTQYLACPTNVKLYVDNSSSIIDITPLRRSLTLGSNPITSNTSTNLTSTFTGYIEEQTLFVTNVASGLVNIGAEISGTGIASGTRIVEFLTGSIGLSGTYKVDVAQSVASTTITTTTSTIIVSDINNGSIIGDIVSLSGATATNGLTTSNINTELYISGIVDANSYSIVINGTASSNGSGGGSNVVAKYEFHQGTSSSAVFAGWGSGPWGGITGSYGWGEGPDTTVTTYYTGLWTVDNYGEDMIACPRDLTNGYTLGGSPVATTNASNTVTVTQVNHGLSNGNAIVIGGITAPIGGIPETLLNGSHTLTVVNANAYTFTVSTASSGVSADTGGTGASVYTPSIVYWDVTDDDGPAVSLGQLGAAYAKSYLPYVATEIMVSDQNRQVLAFGCNPYDVEQKQDKMVIRWSDSNDPTNWDVADTTKTAGEARLSTGSYIVTAVQNREEIIVWTDTALFSMAYVGPPGGYGVSFIGSNFDIIGPNSKIVAGSVAYWMGTNNFYSYDGKIQPLPCTVRDYVFMDLSLEDGDKVYCSADSGNNEIIWFYPSESQGGMAGSREVDRYVVFNYAEQAWYYGSMARTAWVDRSSRPNPRSISPDGYLYNQESGFDDGSTNPPSPIVAYIESSPVEIEDGNDFLFINRVIPDLTFRNSVAQNGYQPSVNFTIRPQDYPGSEIGAGDERTVTRNSSATLNVNRFTNQVFTRLRARSVVLRVGSEDLGVAWRLGTPRFDMRKDGRR